MRQAGVVVPEGVWHMGLRTRALHQAGNNLLLTDCSNAFNTVNRRTVLGEVATDGPVLNVVKRYGESQLMCSFGWTRGSTG